MSQCGNTYSWLSKSVPKINKDVDGTLSKYKAEQNKTKQTKTKQSNSKQNKAKQTNKQKGSSAFLLSRLSSYMNASDLMGLFVGWLVA